VVQFAILFFLAALVAGALGFAGGPGPPQLPARVAFSVFVGLAVLCLVVAVVRKRSLRG